MTQIVECPFDPTNQEDIEQVVHSNLPWNELRGKTVLVTGATGLVGSQIVKTLLAANRIRNTEISVLALVRSKEKTVRVFGDLCNRGDFSLHFADITQPIEISGPVDYILHAASKTASAEFVKHPVETIDTAVIGTKNILELARIKQSAGVVYISSMEVYGNPGFSDHCITETELGYIDNLSVRSCYPESKRICECMCASYFAEYGVPVKIARLAQTFGAGVDVSENRVFAQFAKAVINGHNIVLHTKGESYGNYCYIADAVSGILTVLLKGKSAEAYNVACENATMKIAQVADMVSKDIAGGKIKVVFDIPESTLTYGYAPDVVLRLDSGKLRELGWDTVIASNLQTMYQRLIASFSAQLENNK